MRFSMLVAACVVAVATVSARADDPPAFGSIDFRDGDRVVYLGNTFAERDARYGYLETLLTVLNDEKTISFRNLGWSGDTVWGDARAGFGNRAEGFKQLREHVLALKPTVLLIAYGINESFAGETGLPGFEAGLTTLLDTLAPSNSRMMLIAPLDIEAFGPPLPDPTKSNQSLKRYRDAMRKIAEARQLGWLDLSVIQRQLAEKDRRSTRALPPFGHLSDDGMHPTAWGYWNLDSAAATLLAAAPPAIDGWDLSFEGDSVRSLNQNKVSRVEAIPGGWRFEGLSAQLPPPASPPRTQEDGRSLVFGESLWLRNLKGGKYTLKIDGVEALRFDNLFGLENLTRGPEFDQVEKLRATINAKNELYFYRWRPQNETYLFGFRKHEQGNNAREIPLFDPLVAKKEAEIARLKKPVPHVYELTRDEGDK